MSDIFENDNPYAPGSVLPTAQIQVPSTDDEEIRNKFINHEASVKSIGFLYYLSGCIGGFSGVSLLGRPAGIDSFFVVVGIAVLGISLAFIIAGRGLRRLQPWSRIAGIILSVLGMASFPVGTFVNGYFLYLLASSKSQFVFSDQYKRVMEATPHIKYKTSIIIWILLGLLLFLFSVGIVASIFR
jgi:hypothetical protein